MNYLDENWEDFTNYTINVMKAYISHHGMGRETAKNVFWIADICQCHDDIDIFIKMLNKSVKTYKL